GTSLWANNLELKAMGYESDEYIGRFIGDFHVDQDVIQDILARLTRDETLNAYPARLRAKDGSTKYVMINSNVYHEKGGEFGHTRCFTTEIGEAAWKALKSKKWGHHSIRTGVSPLRAWLRLLILLPFATAAERFALARAGLSFWLERSTLHSQVRQHGVGLPPRCRHRRRSSRE